MGGGPGGAPAGGVGAPREGGGPKEGGGAAPRGGTGRPGASRLRRFLLRPLAALAILLGLSWLALGLFPDPLSQGGGWDWTLRVTDRGGRELKGFLSPSMGRRDFVPLAEVSPYLVSAIITTEDKRFYLHPGFDPLAALRAAWQNLESGGIVSGGSTITMQLARLSLGLSPGPRTYGRKLKETWVALLMERHHPKAEILESYINLVPMGRLCAGFEAASRLYLGKGISELSPAEAALLAALPASPGSLDPFRHPGRAVARRDLILGRMAERGLISPEALERALSEPVALNRTPPPYLAPHFVTQVAGMASPDGTGELRTTLDLGLQGDLEALARGAVAEYRAFGLEQVSVLVLSLPEREVLAWVGSSDFHGPKDGQLDGILAPRQPGSALKPFIYALAFDTGKARASSLLGDSPADFAGLSEVYSPSNYSGAFSAPVSARQALASSLNVPAVNLTEELGVGQVLAKLRDLGLDTLTQEPGHYGLGLALGDGEVSLLALTTAYAALADGGLLQGPVFLLGEAHPRPRRVYSPEAAFLVGDILSDNEARGPGFGHDGVLNTPYPSSVKTGTSSNFKDNWCVGYTDRHVVGVWAGNFSAQPMTEVSGVTGAGQLWRKAMDILANRSQPKRPKPPRGLKALPVCPVSGLPAGPDCPSSVKEWFLTAFPIPPQCRHREMGEPRVVGQPPGFHLISPRPGEIYAYDPGLPPEQQRLRALAHGEPGVDELVWILNGRELGRTRIEGGGRASLFLPLERGPNRLEVLGLRAGLEPLRAGAAYSVK